ncbi:hypothetical protein WJX72_006556 [[Myrmecia] bisecta]|uniref:Aladin n=1 Tax=[Myrmecia] bisecta TaxID=41462 RepID=A0AAW1QFE1_9CHLO
MQDIPGPEKRTVCEANCRLVTADVDQASTSQSPPGQVYPQIYLSSEDETKFLEDCAPLITVRAARGAADDQAGEEGEHDKASLTDKAQAAPLWTDWLSRLATVAQALGVPGAAHLSLSVSQPAGAPPIAWHIYQQRLAVADPADRVQIYDVEAAASTSGRGASEDASMKPKLVLYHEFQRQVSALAWRPHSGRLLASASKTGFGFVIWDAALGLGTPLRAGLERVSLLRWSPNGSYLLAGSPNGSFRLWETLSWSSKSWRGGGAHSLVDACWSPDGRRLLLAFDKANQIAELQFTAPAPALNAQLLPLQLPGLTGDKGEAANVLAMAWDPAHGERLAVAVGPRHPAAGTVALYAVSQGPVLSPRLIGFIRGPPLDGKDAGQGKGTAAGQGEGDVPPVAMAFCPSFPRGSLLAVRRGARQINLYPLYHSAAG